MTLLKTEYEDLSRLEEWIEGLRHRYLRYNAGELMERLGYQDLEEMREAVRRSVSVCMVNRLPVEENIKEIYCEADGVVYKDLKLSPLGYSLLILNGDPRKEEVARMQWYLLKRTMIP